MLAGNAGYDPAATWLIQRTTLTTTATSVTFNSIPQTYASLQVRFIAKNNSAAGALPVFNFNNDTGSNYAYHYLTGNGSAASASGVATTSYIQIYDFPDNTANIFGAAIADIHNYASTTQYKTLRSFHGFDANGSGNVRIGSGLWMSTAAITSVKIDFQGDSYPAGCTFALYGMK